jgi:hypothetical protein
MTEQEWLACTDPRPMLWFLRGKVSDRKFRLFTCATCRCGWNLLQGRSRLATEVGERFADGAASVDELRAAHEEFVVEEEERYRAETIEGGEAASLYRGNVYEASREGAWWNPLLLIDPSEPLDPTSPRPVQGPLAALLAHQTKLIPDVFGNPFRPVAVDPSWLTWNGGTVARLAQGAYDNRHLPSGHMDPARLAVLADALEEAGCTNDAILAHCRQPAPHVRGCWVLDLLLGKS